MKSDRTFSDSTRFFLSQPYYVFGNAGSNEKNNCKPDHNHSEFIMPLASKR
jgi:hypothetical protein